MDALVVAALQSGRAALARHDHAKALAAFERAHRLAPNYVPAVDALAEEYGRLGHADRAVELLQTALAMGSTAALGADTNPAFAAVRASPTFDPVRILIKQRSQRVDHSQPAFRVTQRDLIPEGVAYDPRTGTFFVSSTYHRKVVQITRDGRTSDFTTDMQDGMWGAVGIRVDTIRRVLWILSSSTAGMPMLAYRAAEEGCASAFVYDLATSRLITKYVLCHDGQRHFFNDLAIAARGDVYITDSQLGAVYRIPAATRKLERYLGPSVFTDPNGIALTDEDRQLFVAHETGVDLVDLATRRHITIGCPPTISLGGIDGLAFFKGSLIAVQPDMARVARYHLSRDMRHVRSVDVLDFRRPEFGQPTEGVLVGNNYYYSADAQFSSFDHGVIYTMDRLRDVTILRAQL